ncbi:efflux RND transporter periplasmic adaptor subunit [Actinoplanes solisilvae]|uniref:efflux RND transporter periplasmic adaptor subunit n=1 Tax=Actinoplanes solisilvae TaxID=2486853 RepID=UPI00196A556A|nr:efflux RND transporter periplasmic adaptor subunit [Actinoplanes solisilvae]
MLAKPDAPTEVIPAVADPPPPRRRVGKWLAAGLVLVAVSAGATVLATRHRAGAEPPPPATVPVATAQLERRDLSTVRTLTGTIGFGAARPLEGHRAATVTWLPQPGATIKRGKQIYRANDQPVPLFYGSMPLYRTISAPGTAGRDVRIVADNLRALGYRVGPRPSGVKAGESVLTPDLIKALKRWQHDLGLPENGAVAVGDVEVLTGAVRVDSVAVQPGARADGPLMSVTSTRKVITVAAELADGGSVERGQKVTVTLPDQRVVPSRVTSVGRTLTAADNGPASGPPTLTVTIVADKPELIAGLDSADVSVQFAGRVRKNVLAAPVEALVALSEGGYAVQTATGLVAVKTGMFARGWVEITGAGLTEGVEVVMPS